MKIMSPETHQVELQEIFKDEKLKRVLQPEPNMVNYNIKRKLCRLEIGHCFSLGMSGLKRSGEGISITFDLSKASLNSFYTK